MKKLIIFLLLFCAFNAESQIYQAQNGYGFQYRRLKTDSTLHIPTFCGVPTLRGSVIGNQAAIGVDSCNHKFYFYDPKDSSWSVITGSGTIIVSGSGIDSVTYSSNQLCQWVDGVSTCYRLNKFFDSTSYNFDSTKTIFYNNGIARDSILRGGTDTALIKQIVSDTAALKKNITDSTNVSMLSGGKIDSSHIPVTNITVFHKGDGLQTVYANGTDTIFNKTIKAGTNVTLTQNPDSSITINSTGSGGTGGISKIIAGYGQTQVNDSTTNVDTSKITTVYANSLKADKSTTITINGDTKTLGSNPSWTVSGGGGTSIVKQTYTGTSSVTVNNTTTWLIIDPDSTAAAITITLPASPTDLQDVVISFGGAITSGTVATALTISPNTGQSILQATTPADVQAGEVITYRFTNSKWYRL